MKILGYDSIEPRTVEVTVGYRDGKPVRLKLMAPKLEAINRIQQELSDPEPPFGDGVVRGQNGLPIRDDQGKYIQVRDYEHPDYIQAKVDVHTARGVAMLMACMGNQITDIPERNGEAPVVYYLSIQSKLEDMGLDLLAIKSLTDAAGSLMTVSAEEVEDAKLSLGGAEGNPEASSTGASEPGKSSD